MEPLKKKEIADLLEKFSAMPPPKLREPVSKQDLDLARKKLKEYDAATAAKEKARGAGRQSPHPGRVKSKS